MARGLGLVLALGLGACGSAGPMRPDLDELAPDRIAQRVIDARSGRVLSADALLARLGAVDVLVVGEEHGNPAFHAVQREVVELAYEVYDHRVAIGVEWLPASMNLVLRGFTRPPAARDEPGGTAPVHPETRPEDLDELRRASRWDELWGHDFAAYAPLWRTFRALGIEVSGLNAEPGLARLVSRGGVDNVPPERKAELPPLDSGNPRHKTWFVERMAAAGHPHALGPDALDRMYLAQLVWDETMAKNTRALAEHVERGTRPKVIVLAGAGHVERALGIPARLGPLRRLVILPVEHMSDALDRARDADFPDREADLFWLPPEPRP